MPRRGKLRVLTGLVQATERRGWSYRWCHRWLTTGGPVRLCGGVAGGQRSVVLVIVCLVWLDYMVASFPLPNLFLFNFFHHDGLWQCGMVLVLLRVVAVILRSVWALWR